MMQRRSDKRKSGAPRLRPSNCATSMKLTWCDKTDDHGCCLRPLASRVQEACVADLGGVLREFDIDPCDDISERPVPEGPSRPLRGLHVFVNDTANTEIYTLSLHDALLGL